jgi:glycosyltransferase involved in cell wall biosynthesis
VTVSVVIPLYNKAAYIHRALESVLAQAFADFELIVIDDGSTDGSADAVRRHTDPRIRLISQENAGVGAARNRGMAEAKSGWVAFLDADDEWLPGFLAKIVELIGEHPEAGLVGTAYRYSDAPGPCPGAKALVSQGFCEGLLRNYFAVAPVGIPFCSSSACVRKQAFQAAGGFSEVWGGEDPDLWLRLAVQYPMAYSPDVLAVYHRGMAEQYSNLGRPEPYPPAAESARRLDAEGRIPPAMRPDVMEYVHRLLLWHIDWLLTAGRRREARRILRECRGTRRYRGTWWKQCIQAWLPAWLDRLRQNSRKR